MRPIFLVIASLAFVPCTAMAQMVDSNPEPEIVTASADDSATPEADVIYGASAMVASSLNNDPDADLDDLGLTPPGTGGSISSFFGDD